MISSSPSEDNFEDFSFQGKLVAIAVSTCASRLDRLPEYLREHAVELPTGAYQVKGFVLATVVHHAAPVNADVVAPDTYSQLLVQLPYWTDPEGTVKEEPSLTVVHSSNVIRFITDDEAEPDILCGLPRLLRNLND